MSAKSETAISPHHVMVLRSGSALWSSFDRVVRDTAHVVLPDRIDRDACRAILELNEGAERGDTTAPETAEAAIRILLSCYPRPQISDPEMMSTILGMALARQPAGIVAMAVNWERGIPSRHRFMPSMEQVRSDIEEILRRISSSSRGARRALAEGHSRPMPTGQPQE